MSTKSPVTFRLNGQSINVQSWLIWKAAVAVGWQAGDHQRTRSPVQPRRHRKLMFMPGSSHSESTPQRLAAFRPAMFALNQCRPLSVQSRFLSYQHFFFCASSSLPLRPRLPQASANHCNQSLPVSSSNQQKWPRVRGQVPGRRTTAERPPAFSARPRLLEMSVCPQSCWSWPSSPSLSPRM